MRNRLPLFVIVLCFVSLTACDAASQPELPTASPIPAMSLAASYTRTTGVEYAAGQTMDIYAPSDPGDYPVVIAFHGNPASPESFISLGLALADNGIVTFAAGWHSAPPAADDFLWGWEDAACAVRWVRENAAAYGGNPERIIVVGHSAGGAVGAVVTLGGDDFQSHCLGGENISALADGFVGLDGAYHILNHVPDDTKSKVPEEIEELIDPFYQVGAQPLREDVKFILFVSNHEELRIYAKDFHSVLQSAGYSSELTMFDDINHNGIVGGSNEEIVNAIVELAYDW